MPRVRTRRKKKDPNRPKRPLTPYMVFVKENIAIIASRFDKDTRRSEIIKNCGEQWRKLAPKKREHYIREAEKDKQRFIEELEDYVPPPPSAAEKTGKRRKKYPNAPKRPLTAYMSFVSEHQPKFAKKFDLQKDVMHAIGDLWRKTQDKDKKKYQKRAEIDRERYRTEMETYVKPVITVPKAKKEKKDPLKPKRIMSAYAFYVKDRRPSLASKYENNFENGKKVMKELGAGWAEMGKKEKKKYQDKAARDKIRYNSQMERYKALMESGVSRKAVKGVKKATRKPAKKAPVKKPRSPDRKKAKV